MEQEKCTPSQGRRLATHVMSSDMYDFIIGTLKTGFLRGKKETRAL
jgi:hypothetical protein